MPKMRDKWLSTRASKILPKTVFIFLKTSVQVKVIEKLEISLSEKEPQILLTWKNIQHILTIYLNIVSCSMGSSLKQLE